MTPKPNVFGYLVLAAFGAAGIYAITRKAQAKPLVCPEITAARVSHFNIALDAAIIWAKEHDTPPAASVNANGLVVFAGAPDKTFQPPVIVITADEKFWRYEGEPGSIVVPEAAPDARDAFCALG